jgi:aldehyde:ferredoxin oxidoreductase
MTGHVPNTPRVLHVDLRAKRVWKDSLSPDLVSLFGGGRGIGARLLWDMVPPGIDPLGPNNPLIFSTGVLTGTVAPCSGRTTVLCKSPATHRYLKSSVGGNLGAQLRFAGYDHLVVHGASSAPVYLWIDDDSVEIRDAEHLWGRSVSHTHDALTAELSASNLETAIIGPAGENLIAFASIMVSVGCAAARGGTGAVMGSKKLKAIAVRGTGSVRVADWPSFTRIARDVAAEITSDEMIMGLHLYGTAGMIEAANEFNTLPAYNFQQSSSQNAHLISGPELTRLGIARERRGCASCVIACHLHSSLRDGRYSGTRTLGPEYETIASLGMGVGVFDPDVLIRASHLCNELGMDTISAGAAIAWAMECVERGVLSASDFDGLPMTWGHAESVLTVLELIANRAGVGALLADGLRSAAHTVGLGSERWAVQAGGLEQSRVDTRASKGYALAFAVNPRGPDHLHTQTFAESGECERWRAIIEEITGDESYAVPTMTEKRAEIVRWHEDYYAACDSFGICTFTFYAVHPSNMCLLFTSATGIESSPSHVLTLGRRIVNLERAFNAREGFGKEDDRLPYRLMFESTPGHGMTNSPEELAGMLGEYYRLHGWNPTDGLPTREILDELSLAYVADELDHLQRLGASPD